MNLHSKNLIAGLKARFFLALALVTLVAVQITAEAKPTPFSRIVVLGDSLSDTGNFYQLSGGWPPSPPYAGGRFSNGELWVEYLADTLGMTIAPGDNHAVGGATTGTFNSNNGLAGQIYPGLQQQVAAVVAAGGGALDSDALYVIWAGANDFFVTLATGGDPAVLIGQGVQNTLIAVQTLWAAGARHILVPNVPDLGLTPYALGSGFAPTITQLSFLYNQALGGALQALGNAGVTTIRVDAFSTLQNMVYNGADFGFTNVTSPFLFTGGNPAEFVFWDTVHPTTEAHAVLGAEAVDELIRHYSPSNGKGAPAARVNALKGLVNAGHPK